MSEDPRDHLARDLLGGPYSDLNPIQRSVIDLIATAAPTGLHPKLLVDDRSVGQRLADNVAAIGGSWAFIAGFGVVLAVWMSWNVAAKLFDLAFDPYPFIFLNLMLSMLAAIQAPVIMMSQNRAAQRDRENAEHDYVVNLRAELEIMHLHAKLDALRDKQIVELLQKQSEAIELLKAQVATI
jgi:uncharacterized membrane protein